MFFIGLGEVYTWGDNDEGQLGDGTTNAIQRPRLVAALQGKKINRVACGSAHTLAWSTSKPANAGKLPTQVIFLAYWIQILNILSVLIADLSVDVFPFQIPAQAQCALVWLQVRASYFVLLLYFQRIPFYWAEKASAFSF